MNLYQKLAAVQSVADVVQKSKRGYNYSYADINDILAKVTSGMKKYNLLLIPNIVQDSFSVCQQQSVNTKVDKAGNTYDQTLTEMVVNANIVFRWLNVDEPEEILDVPWVITGSQSDPSQAFGSGLTYCTRYFLTNFFHIGQIDGRDDVDSYRSKQREAMDAQDLEVAVQITSELDTSIRLFLSEFPDQSDAVKAIVKKYVKTGDYNKIKSPEVAMKLLHEFEDFAASVAIRAVAEKKE